MLNIDYQNIGKQIKDTEAKKSGRKYLDVFCMTKKQMKQSHQSWLCVAWTKWIKSKRWRYIHSLRHQLAQGFRAWDSLLF